jgi:hypothetical protein
LAAISVVALSLPGTAVLAAFPAVHIIGIPIAVSYLDPFLSDACGFDVTFTLTGTSSVTLVYNDAGLVIREVDTEPAARKTFAGNGQSVSYEGNAISVTTYPEGASIGAPATSIETGYFGIPSSANAGPDVLVGHVTEITTGGIPLVEFDDVLASHGPRPDFVAAICGALDG